MLEEALKLLHPKLLTILDTTPSSIAIWLDTRGRWNVEDCEVLWANKRMISMLGHAMNRGRFTPHTKQTHRIGQAILDTIKQCYENTGCHDGFHGPFPIGSDVEDDKIKKMEISAMLAGFIGNSLPVLLQVIHQKANG
ncbi:uncharacterized protein Dvar_85190 [Desulfosarcina variabilis str. Montpellier]|uniref:hypothetical protein n=1 Tax=Desulfosarcina variabilis TaxID=2300 RepID=UPI003AFB243B